MREGLLKFLEFIPQAAIDSGTSLQPFEDLGNRASILVAECFAGVHPAPG